MGQTDKKSSKAFTLIEVLLVVAILAILIGITVVAINPARQLMKSRDAERTAAVFLILSNLHQYISDHNGEFPEMITTEEREICRTDSVDCTGLYNLSALTDNQEYMVSIPEDPLCTDDGQYCDPNGTGYSLQATASGKITISAQYAEGGEMISVTR